MKTPEWSLFRTCGASVTSAIFAALKLVCNIKSRSYFYRFLSYIDRQVVHIYSIPI